VLSPIDTIDDYHIVVSGQVNNETVPTTVYFNTALPPGLANIGTNGISYDGVQPFANPIVNLEFILTTTDSNYSVPNTPAVVNLSVHDGLASGARAIPVTQANIIRPVTGFNAYANTSDGLSKHYVLTQNVTLTPSAPGDSNWTAIGTQADRFSGSFNGNGFSIGNININQTSGFQGMFGAFMGDVKIENLILMSVNIRGSIFIAGIVGVATGSNIIIENCHVQGVIIGTNDTVGGIVGDLFGSANRISNSSFEGNVSGRHRVGGIAGSIVTSIVEFCSSSGNITGVDDIGGLVAVNTGTVRNSFSAANVSSTGSPAGLNIGGVVGIQNISGIVRNTYATGVIIGGDHVGGVIGNITTGSAENSVAINASITSSDTNIGRIAGFSEGGTNLDMNFSREGLFIDGSPVTGGTATNINGANITDSNYYNLWTTLGFTDPWWTAVPDRLPNLANYLNDTPIIGNGTPGSPFEIYTEMQLRQVGRGSEAATGYTNWTLNASYKLMTDITLTGTNNWIPIGSTGVGNSFRGRFDGNGKTITGIHINTSAGRQGMFGYIVNGIVENLTIQNAYIQGSQSVGSIVGSTDIAVTIRNCVIINSTVNGNNWVGGAVGHITGGTNVVNVNLSNIIISNTTVTGSEGFAGGLIGLCSTGLANVRINNIYVDASVVGEYIVGTIAGSISGANIIIENSVTLGNSRTTSQFMSLSSRVGGIAGQTSDTSFGGVGITIRHNVVLNENISTIGTNIGRIHGLPVAGITLNNNYARSDMDVRSGTNADGTGGTPKTIDSALDSIDGLDITATQWSDRAWWTAQGFTDSWWDDNNLLPITNITGMSAPLMIDLDFEECIICEDECECFNNGNNSFDFGLDKTDPVSGETDNSEDKGYPDSDTSDKNDPDSERIEPHSSSDLPLELIIVLPLFSISALVRKGQLKRVRQLLCKHSKRNSK